MRIAGKTDKGFRRADNQDRYIAGALANGICFGFVCDGMGGANGGNIASALAIRTITTRLVSSYRQDMTMQSMQRVLESAIAAANVAVYDEAAASAELRGMGTTLVMAVMMGDRVLIAHIGDSRAYVITQDNTVEQITKDHSVVQQMLERGQITAEEAKSHPRRNFITRALGVSDTVACDFSEFVLPDGAKVMLCTDGLSGMVDLPRIQEIAASCDDRALPDRLIAAANLAGGSDNVTVALITR